MTNLERLNLETKGFDYPDSELTVYLSENSLVSTDTYDPISNINKRSIYLTALSILESLANNPTLMKSYKTDDISVTDFAESLQNRIDQLDKKVRLMSVSDEVSANNSTFMLFSS